MTPELKWLALTCVVTTLMWIPYIINLISVRGLLGAIGYPENPRPMDDWAARLKQAHYNAVENLVVFGLLVVIAHLVDIHSDWTVMACVTYFWARFAYAIVYASGVPIVRTMVFAISWLCILTMAGSVLL